MYSYKAKTVRDYLREMKCAVYDNTIMFLRSQLATHEDYFSCGKEWYQYARLKTNTAYATERVIELPIVMQYVHECEGKILEVGNVLNHYYRFSHDVVDKYEKADTVLNQDIIEFSPSEKYGLAISISTLEHVGFDEEEKDKRKFLLAVEKMISSVKSGGKAIITVPLGYNSDMDKEIKSGKVQATKMYLMHRISCENEWKEESINLLQTENFKYGSPYPYANWVLIMIIEVP